jgi:hypothetical protein
VERCDEVLAHLLSGCFHDGLVASLLRASYGRRGQQEQQCRRDQFRHLTKIFRLEVKKWHDDKDVILVLHKNSSGEMSTLERLNKMSSSELKSFIAAHQGSITLVDSDEEVLKVVETMPGAVGLVDVRSINDQINVVRVDGKLPMEDGYLPH